MKNKNAEDPHGPEHFKHCECTDTLGIGDPPVDTGWNNAPPERPALRAMRRQLGTWLSAKSDTNHPENNLGFIIAHTGLGIIEALDALREELKAHREK